MQAAHVSDSQQRTCCGGLNTLRPPNPLLPCAGRLSAAVMAGCHGLASLQGVSGAQRALETAPDSPVLGFTLGHLRRALHCPHRLAAAWALGPRDFSPGAGLPAGGPQHAWPGPSSAAVCHPAHFTRHRWGCRPAALLARLRCRRTCCACSEVLWCPPLSAGRMYAVRSQVACPMLAVML